MLQYLNLAIMVGMILVSCSISGYVFYLAFKNAREITNTLANEENLLIKYHKDIEETKDWEEVKHINSQFISHHPKNLTPFEAYLSIRKRTKPR